MLPRQEKAKVVHHHQSVLFKKKKIKAMNNKMAINTYLSTIESKKRKLSKQEQRQNHGCREVLVVATWEGLWESG